MQPIGKPRQASSGEELDLHRGEADGDHVGGAVGDCASTSWISRPDLRGSTGGRGGRVVQTAEGVAGGVDESIDEDEAVEPIPGIGVRDDHDFLVVQDAARTPARPGRTARRRSGRRRPRPAGSRAGRTAARAGGADLAEARLDRLVEGWSTIEGVGLAPEGLADVLIAVAVAVQALLGAVIQAGDALEAEEERDASIDLGVERVGGVGGVPVRSRSFMSWLSRNVTK